MCDSTRVNEPIQGSRVAQTVNDGHSTKECMKPAQVPERYPIFNPLGVQKDAGFSRFTPMPISLREHRNNDVFLFATVLENEEVAR